MVSRTSIAAIRLLIYVASAKLRPAVLSHAARRLNESPTYLAKVARLLVRSGILRAQRGVGGGVTLARSAADISFLNIVEACQGKTLPDFCQGNSDLGDTCAFHQAASQLHESIVKVLDSWTLQDFLSRPGPHGAVQNHPCWIQIRRTGKKPRATARERLR